MLTSSAHTKLLHRPLKSCWVHPMLKVTPKSSLPLRVTQPLFMDHMKVLLLWLKQVNFNLLFVSSIVITVLFIQEDIVIHFENNAPFLSVANLLRHIEVSHWGNIAVEETLDVYHGGAKLKGSFSRFEYQREHSGVSSIKSFKVRLPFSSLTFSLNHRNKISV